MGTSRRADLVYVIDFGLSKRFEDARTRVHIPYRENKQLTGTPRYASINAHLGIEQSRRDDLESLGYVLLYFLRGSLPWQGLKAPNKKRKYKLISDTKLGTSLEHLCRGVPDEFRMYMEYCKALRFTDKPDYSFLRKRFQALAARNGIEYDSVFDWMHHRVGSGTPRPHSSISASPARRTSRSEERHSAQPKQAGGGGGREADIAAAGHDRAKPSERDGME